MNNNTGGTGGGRIPDLQDTDFCVFIIGHKTPNFYHQGIHCLDLHNLLEGSKKVIMANIIRLCQSLLKKLCDWEVFHHFNLFLSVLILMKKINL